MSVASSSSISYLAYPVLELLSVSDRGDLEDLIAVHHLPRHIIFRSTLRMRC